MPCAGQRCAISRARQNRQDRAMHGCPPVQRREDSEDAGSARWPAWWWLAEVDRVRVSTGTVQVAQDRMRLARGARRRRRGKGAGDRHAPDLWRQILATLSVIQHAVAEKPLALAQQALEDDLQLLVWERRTRPNPRLRLDQAITAARRPLGFIAIRRVCSDWPGNTLPPGPVPPVRPHLRGRLAVCSRGGNGWRCVALWNSSTEVRCDDEPGQADSRGRCALKACVSSR